MSTQLLSPEQTEALNKARRMNAKPRPPVVPELKLVQTDIGNIKAGNYIIKTYNPETKESDITKIGENPKVTILHRAYSYSYFDEVDKELKAWTNEFTGFTNLDQTFLFSKKDGKAVAEFQGNYPQLKRYKNENYCFKKGANVMSLLKFRTILYVLYAGKPYRMFVSNASNSGIDPDTGKPADMGRPMEGSLGKFCQEVSHSDANAFFEHTCALGSTKIEPEGKPAYYLMTFKEEGKTEDLGAVTNIYMQLLSDLEIMLRNDVERMSIATMEKEESSDVKVAAEVMNSDLLPF